MNKRLVALALVAMGAAAAAYGVFAAPERTWPNLLLNGFYIASLSVSAMFFAVAQRLSGARWAASLRRIPEALMLAMPYCALLILMLYLGRRWIYPWTLAGAFAHAPDIAGKAQFLQTPWVFARMAAILTVWVVFALLFRHTSLQQDHEPGSGVACHLRLNRYAAGFAPLLAVSFAVAAYDWIGSLEPDWSSTMFAIYVFSGTFVAGIAAVTLVAASWKHPEHKRPVSNNQLHDLGKMLFAFSTFWAYIWTCEYLLIWYGNIPEEVTHYLKRTSGPWLPWFALNFTVNWVIPFGALLSARAKRDPRRLRLVAMLLLGGHWLDLYMLIMPSIHKAPPIGVPEVLIAAGYAALLYLLFVHNLGQAALAPLHDPVRIANSRSRQAHERMLKRWAAGVPR